MKHKILFPLLVFGMVTSCSKDESGDNPGPDPANEITAAYSAGSTLIIDQIALYTKDGVITDLPLIQSFLNRHVTNADDKKLFYYGQTSVNNPGITFNLNIYKNDRVYVNNEFLQLTHKDDFKLEISRYDSAQVPPISAAYCGRLLSQVPAYTPTSNCPNGDCSKYRKTFPVLIDRDNLYLPLLSFAVTGTYKEVINDRDVNTTCSTVSPEYPMYNVVSEQLSANLTDRDTALVQLARLPLVLKSK